MNILDNFGFAFLAVVVTVNVFLARMVYKNDTKNDTNTIFVLLSTMTTIWLVVTRLAIEPSTFSYSLYLARLSVFLAVPHSILFFMLAYTIPEKVTGLRKQNLIFIIVGGVALMALTLSPFVFKEAKIVNGALVMIPDWGMAIFSLFTSFFSIASIYVLAKKIRKSSENNIKKQLWSVAIGMFLMLGSIILTIVIPVMFVHESFFVQFAPLYTCLFLGMIAYSIIRHGLFNVKVFATQIFVFTIGVTLFIRIFLSSTGRERTMDLIIFLFIVVFGTLLIRSVQQEVEQRKKIEQIAKDLAVANEHLRELDREKSEFVSIASHQLRTPLTAISGYASMLIEGSYGKLSKKSAEAVSRIYQSSGRLVLIIEDFLDITKIEQGRMTYQFVTVDMKGLLQGLVEEMQPRAREKNAEIVLDAGDHGSYNATADIGKIRQVLSNLIDNAIKYSGTGKIDVVLTRDIDRGKIQVSVHDTGIGISPQTMGKLFQKFSRAEGVKKIYTEGSGLGLYVAQEMMKAHYGRLWAESEGEGKGSTFHVELMGED